ncbi:hypothetical protein NA23_06060 [Fervidobacterium islandicum]|uniref:Uncharacterized protein n=1 Tax=Fervidobacterium islandicum TaxID=2423 RepID=A0AAI8CLU5_FERIS|nr:hypothetical protein [Fervidobacterium islandicum]AMW32870.1 hypothetical protein NA23_06060 [Fervidobacterium islandicum]
MEESRIRSIKRALLLFFLLLQPWLVLTGFAVEFSLTASYNIGESIFTIYNLERLNTPAGFFNFDIGINHSSEAFQFKAIMSARNDGVYNDPFSESYYAGYYFNFKEGSITFKNNSLSISVGKTHLQDVVDSPYSLFISSVPIPRNVLDFTYDDGKFFYVTRWIELCNRSEAGLDTREKLRSANYKVYALRLGNLRFGYQDVSVYAGQNFSFEYFANPLPSFFIQYVNDAGRPYPEGLGETNYISGFFLDYDDGKNYYCAQVLVDDINMNRFLHPESYQNPDKIAWSLGLVQKTSIGTFGFYHAGATKYTFQPSAESGNQRFYGYTYYTDFVYNTSMILPLEFVYAGYKYGENNIAFMFSYVPSDIPDLNTSFEFVVLGERSPVNAWNDRTTYIPGTHLLDDPVREYRAVGEISYSPVISDGVKLFASLSAGFIWNVSTLVEIDSDNVKKPLLRPQHGNNIPFFSVNIGVLLSKSF